MKTMTCREMGGPCDAKLSADTPKEMIEKGMEHVKKSHPEMIKDMDKMSKEEGKKWNDTFMKKCDMTPDSM